MNNSFGSAGGFLTSPAAPKEGGQEGVRRATNLVPVTVQQILQATTTTPLLLYGKEVNLVCMYGTVKSVERTETKIEISVDDNTGLIKGRQWLGSSADSTPELKIGEVVRLVGTVASDDSSGERCLQLFRIFKLHDERELKIHDLEMQLMELAYQKGITNLSELAAARGGAGAAVGDTTPAAADLNFSQLGGLAGYTDKQRMVFLLYKSAGANGLSTQVAQQRLVGKMNQGEFKAAFDFLVEDGMLYNLHEDVYRSIEE